MLTQISDKILQTKIRYILPVIIILLLKVVSSFFIYQRLSILGSFYTPWMDYWKESGPVEVWLYLFSAQDTGHYVALTHVWYQYPLYVFFPAYPVLCKVIGLLVGDMWLAAFIISIFFGFASIPLFQMIAEQYMSRAEAVGSTMFFASFPYVFLFTTLSYTESLFLFFTLAAWYLNLKDKFFSSSLAAAVATLTKTYGIVIIIPIAINMISKRKFKHLTVLAIPVMALLGWLYYLYLRTGDAFVFSKQQEYWISLGVQFGWFQNFIEPLLNFNVWKFQEFNYLVVALVLFLAFITFCVFKIDSKLGAYSLILFLSLLYFGNYVSLPRFFAFIFPIWLIVRIKNILALGVAMAFFLLASLLIWYQFLLDVWVT
jgi:Gpi18-like mannosyltransferase